MGPKGSSLLFDLVESWFRSAPRRRWTGEILHRTQCDLRPKYVFSKRLRGAPGGFVRAGP